MFGGCRRRKKTPTAAIAITTAPPIKLPTIAPVFELLPLEGEDVGEGDEKVWGDVESEKGEEVASGKTVGLGEVVPVGPEPVVELVVFGPPINKPGPTSGVSKSCTCEEVKEKTETRISYRQYPLLWRNPKE